MLLALQSERHFTAEDLCKMYGISRRTFFRDLRALQSAGIPYCCNKKTCSYSLEKSAFFPSLNLSKQEALSLFLLVYKARDSVYFPFKNSALRAILKIENSLPVNTKKYYRHAIEHISVKTNPQITMESFDFLFSQLQKAILSKRFVRILYHLPCEKETILILLSPYHLIYAKQEWYVIGKSNVHKQILNFKLNQIKKIDIINKCFVEDDKFDVSKYLGLAWSIKPEGTLYHVKLKFAPKIANHIMRFQWHSTQRMNFDTDGALILEFRVDGLDEIVNWVLGYGNQVEILAPSLLRQKLLEVIKNIAETYQKSSIDKSFPIKELHVSHLRARSLISP